MIARDHAPTPRAMRLPIRPWHPCRGWPDVSSGRKEGREMHGGLLWAAFEEWAAHHHSARRSVGLHRHAASEPHRLLLGPVPAAGRPARQRAWPTCAAPQTSRKKSNDDLNKVVRWGRVRFFRVFRSCRGVLLLPLNGHYKSL